VLQGCKPEDPSNFLQQACAATGGLALSSSRFVTSQFNGKKDLPTVSAFCKLLDVIIHECRGGYVERKSIMPLISAMGRPYNRGRQHDSVEFFMAVVDKCSTESRLQTGEGGPYSAMI
jgi:hypothetical protein